MTRVEIGSEADVVTACQRARALAERLGFSATESAHIVTAISEVAGNIWLYAGRGRVELAPADERERVGLTVVARDSGPGIEDVEQALRDGYSTSGGMGLGLPGARRLMDDFRVESERGAGTTVTMTRWRPRDGAAVPAPPLVDWASARTGDAEPASRRCIAAAFDGGTLLGVVAGLGSDDAAGGAARTAASILERHASESPVALIGRCHEALRGGRGAAMALASASALDARMTWAGVGHVEAHLLRGTTEDGPITEPAPVLRGVVGHKLPPLQAATVPVMRGDMLVMATGEVAPEPLRSADSSEPPAELAQRLTEVAPRAGLVLAARFLRGVRERSP